MVGDKKEEVLQRETPSQRYVSGMLYPMKTSANDEASLESPIHEENEEYIPRGHRLRSRSDNSTQIMKRVQKIMVKLSCSHNQMILCLLQWD